MSPPIVFGDLVAVGGFVRDSPQKKSMAFTPRGDLRAFDVGTDELAWIFHTVPTEGEFVTAPSFYIDTETYLFAFDLDSGRELARVELPSNAYATTWWTTGSTSSSRSAAAVRWRAWWVGPFRDWWG